MVNLITQEQKKIIQNDYRVRLAIAYLLLLTILGVFFLGHLVSYYLSLNKKEQIISGHFQKALIAENNENTGESASHVTRRTLEELVAVETLSKGQILPSVFFEKIIANKDSGIKIQSLSFSPTGQGQNKFIVTGLAETREGLVDFIEDLKVQVGFSSVEIPISQFAEESNIKFTLEAKK